MPRGGARIGAGRPKGGGKATVANPAAALAKSTPDVAGSVIPAPVEPESNLPLEYMLAVMNDLTNDPLRRDRMAIAAAPFLHAKAGELGKKGARQLAAGKVAAGKFAPAAPPRLVVNNK